MKNKTIIILGITLVGLSFAVAGFFLEEKEVSLNLKKEEKSAEEGELLKVDFEAQEKEENGSDLEKKITENSSENRKISEIEKEAEEKKDPSQIDGIKNNLVSWGFSKNTDRSIDTVIIHSSYNALGGEKYDFKKLLAEYKEYGVAPHYLIDRKGVIYRLVEDKNIAWHAGESKTPDGRKNVNDFSIGIELMNTKTEKYTSEQYDTLSKLLDYLKGKYKIKYTLGHKDISLGRKDDPWNFDWGKLK